MSVLGTTGSSPLSKFNRSSVAAAAPVTARAGYTHTLGASLDLGLLVPVWPGVNLGADLGEYTARGLIAGPTGSSVTMRTDRTSGAV